MSVHISKADIDQRIIDIVQEIGVGYKSNLGNLGITYGTDEFVLIGILDGSFMFIADLARQLSRYWDPLTIDFIKIASYNKESFVSNENPDLQRKTSVPIKDKLVLLVDDIIETGLTLAVAIDYIMKQEPSKLLTCALLDKPSRRKSEIEVDWAGFVIPNEFVVGYGLGYKDNYRGRPFITTLSKREM